MYTTSMRKKIIIKDKKVKTLLKNGGRKEAKKIFFELLKRSLKSS